MKFPKSGNIEDLPQEIIDEFLDKINFMKREGLWENFKEVKGIQFEEDNILLFYTEGDIIAFKKLNEEEVLVYNIPFEKEHENDI